MRQLVAMNESLHGHEAEDSRLSTWTEAIFERCFPLGRRGRIATLDFDDEARVRLERQLSSPGYCGDEFVDLLRARLDVRNQHNVFHRFTSEESDTESGHPRYIFLLAAFSLAASRRAIGKRSFHTHLRTLCGIDERKPLRGFEMTSRTCWTALAKYLNEDCKGERGSLFAGRVFLGGDYVNMAISQVLLPSGEREALRVFFAERFPPNRAADGGSVFDAVVREAKLPHGRFSPMLRRRIELLQAGADVQAGGDSISALARLIVDEYETWYLEELYKRESLPPPNSDHGPRKEKRSTASTVRNREVAAERSVDYDVTVELDGVESACPRIFAVVAAHGERLIGTVEIDDDELKIFVSGAVIRLSVENLYFQKDHEQRWNRVVSLRSGWPTSVIDDRQAIEILAKQLRDCGIASRVMSVSDSTALVVFTIPNSPPEWLRNRFALDRTAIWTIGGIKIDDAYLAGAPPHVIFRDPNYFETNVVLNGVTLGVGQREVPFPLGERLPAGTYVCRIGSGALCFTVSDDVVEACEATEPVFGFLLSAPRGVARLEQNPGESTIARAVDRHVVLTGGLLL